MHKDLMVSPASKQWQKTQSQSDNFIKTQTVANPWQEKHYDGYEKTYFNVNIPNNDLSNYPALKYATELNINGYKGYLPEIGQLTFIYSYIDLINYILRTIGGTQLNSLVHIKLWSSTEDNYCMAYILNRHSYRQRFMRKQIGRQQISYSASAIYKTAYIEGNSRLTVMPLFSKNQN